MNILQSMLLKIQTSIQTYNIALYGNQHAVLFDIAMEKQNLLGNWMGALDEIGYITSCKQPFFVNGQPICVGAFDNCAWKMGGLELVEGRQIEYPNQALIEEKTWKQFFPNLKIGDTFSLPVTSPSFENNQFIFTGVIRNYSSVWEEVYYKWPPTSGLFPNIVLSRDVISGCPITTNALVKFQPQAARQILQEDNAFLRELRVQWARNEKTYNEQWNEDQEDEIQLVIATLPILTAVCTGACIIYLCVVMMKAHKYQMNSLIDLGIALPSINRLYFMEYFFWLFSSIIVSFFASLILSNILGVVTLHMSWAESTNLTTGKIQPVLTQNLVNLLWFAALSLISISIYQRYSSKKSNKKRINKLHREYFRIPAVAFLAWRLFRKNLRSYISGILCIGVGISVFLYTCSIVRETVDITLPDEPDYVVSVLSNSDVIPYGERAKLPIHIGAYRKLSNGFIQKLSQLDSVERICSYHASYDWILSIPKTYIEDGEKWMYYDMEPHYSKDPYTYRRRFINHFTTERALINDGQEGFQSEYQAVKELESIGLDWENNAITTCLLQESDDLTWDGIAELIPCKMEIAESHLTYFVKSGSIINGVYLQYLGDTEGVQVDTVLDETNSADIDKLYVKFDVKEVALSNNEDMPVVLYVPRNAFAKYGQDGYQRVEVFLNENQAVDEVNKLASTYKEENTDTVYIENREEQAIRRRILRQKLLTTVGVVNAILAISGGLQIYFCFAAHMKSRRKQLQLYCELGLGGAELCFIKYSDLAFSGIFGVISGITLCIFMR